MKEKSNILPAVVSIVSFILFSGISFADNLVINPGFEASSTDAVNWKISGPVPSMKPLTALDKKVFFSGNSGLRMESNNPNCHGIAAQKISVKGDQAYQVSVRYRTSGIKSVHKSVLIRVKWFREDEQLGYNYIYTERNEDGGWILASDKIRSVAGTTAAEINLVFRWSTGTVWWDDIVFESCEPEQPRKIKVGTFYFRPPGPTVEKNVSLMSEMLDKAGKAGCTIVCLPEGWPTCNTGLGMQKTEANTLEGSASVMMSRKAKEYGMYIVSGLYSWKDDTLKNVAVLYGRKGNIEGIYEKVQLPDSETEAGAIPGNEFPVFTTDFGKIGILICWDSAFPEISRILAINGAEILFCPVWGDVRDPDMWKLIARARAVDNGVYFVTNIFDGHSVIVNPAGEVLQESSTQGSLLVADVDLNYNPRWYWLGNAGLGVWKTVWRKDRRSDVFGDLTK